MAAPDPAPAPDPVELDLGWSLRVVLRAYLDAANEAFADIPSGPRGYALLVHVVRGEPGSQLALARRLGLDRTVMTYLVDDLVEAGLLERQVDPTDRRARVLVPTTRARRLLPALDRRLATVEDGLLASLSAVDGDRLRRLLRTVATDVVGQDPIDDPRDLTEALGGTVSGRAGAPRRRPAR